MFFVLQTIDGDLKEIAEDLMTAQVLTDSICQDQNKQHVNEAIINEKTRQLCTQFDVGHQKIVKGGAKNEICKYLFLKKVLNLGPKGPKLPFDLLHRPVAFLGQDSFRQF